METSNNIKYKNAHSHIDDNAQFEFRAVEKYCRGLGFDFGCGNNRLSPTVLSMDYYPHKQADMVWQILDHALPFADNVFDFIFTSHCLEDLPPDRMQYAFDELLRITKVGGYLISLAPMMDGIRYPRWDEKFTAESPEVIKGERRVGDCIGNPSHLIDWDLELCHKLKTESKYKTEVVQENTLPENQMTIDFVILKK